MSNDPGRAVTIFTDALQYPVAEREAFLDRACVRDDALRRKVEELLRAHQHLGNFMETPGFSLFDPEIDEEPPEPNANNGGSNNK